MAAKAFIFPEICELRLDLLNCLRIIFQLKKGSLEGNVFLNITEQHGRCIVICFDYLGLLRHAVAVDPELSRFVASLPFWRQLQVKRDGTTAKRFVTEVNDFIVLFQLVSGHAHEAESYEKDLRKIYQDILDEKEEIQNKYDKETNHSINREKQAEWLLKIADMLEEFKNYTNY